MARSHPITVGRAGEVDAPAAPELKRRRQRRTNGGIRQQVNAAMTVLDYVAGLPEVVGCTLAGS